MIFAFFSVATQRGPLPPRPHLKLASDWLGVGLEQKSFCHWPTCQTGKTGTQRFEEYLHSKYGRLQIDPHYISRIVFNLHDVFFFLGGGANLKLCSEMSNIKCAVSERVNGVESF